MNHSGKLLSYWDQRAAVRTKTRHYDNYRDESSVYFFRPNLVPLLSHEDFRNASEDVVRELQILQLSRYLFNTEIMETNVINPALLALQRLAVDSETKLNGYKIYTDEAYHALMSAEVRHKLHKETGVAETPLPTSEKQAFVLSAVAGLPEHLREVGLVAVAAVNETLISANLSQANDAGLVPAVREMIAHHAEDEAVHHVFFSDVFAQLWPRLELDDQRELAPVVALAMQSFLENDASSIACDLERFGYSRSEALTIAGESIISAGNLSQPLNGTIKMLARSDALAMVQAHFPTPLVR